jgi:hypothetical protein
LFALRQIFTIFPVAASAFEIPCLFRELVSESGAIEVSLDLKHGMVLRIVTG